MLKYILGSLNNGPDGASGKKMAALFSMIFCFVIPTLTWCVWAYKHNDFSNLTTVLITSSSLITAMFVTNEVGKKINPPAATSTDNEPK